MAQQGELEELKTWILDMGQRGLYPKTTARFRANAIDTLTTVLGPEEPRDLRWILANLEELGKRWTTLNNGTPNTAKTYVSRARTALVDYTKHQDDPASFKGRRRKVGGVAGENRRSFENITPPQQEPQTETPPSGTHPLSRTYPLSDDRTFSYALPREGISVMDSLRIFYHLATLAYDFDPTDPSQTRIFSLVRRE